MRSSDLVTYGDLVYAYGSEEGINQMFLDYHMGLSPLLPTAVMDLCPEVTPEDLWNNFGTQRFTTWLVVKIWKRLEDAT